MTLKTFLDRNFYYSTTKVILVRDYKVGLLYWVLTLGVIGWSVYNVITEGSYLAKTTPSAVSDLI